MALLSLGAKEIGSAMPVLMVGWAFTITLVITAILRLAVRDNTIMTGGLATVVCRRNVSALTENLITEDLMKANRPLKMTLGIVTASIFNLHQFISTLVEVSTTVSQGARKQETGIEQVTSAAELLQQSLEGISLSTERNVSTIGRAARQGGSSIRLPRSWERTRGSSWTCPGWSRSSWRPTGR